MKKEFELSIILPLKSSVVRDFDEFFKKSIESLTIQDILPTELIIVHSEEKSLIDYLNNFDFGDLNLMVSLIFVNKLIRVLKTQKLNGIVF